MRHRFELAVRTALAIALAAVALLTAGRVAFARRVARETRALLAASRPASSHRIREEDLADLPEPIQRWLRCSGVVGMTLPAVVRLRQAGRFRQAPDAPWRPFTAWQVYTTDPPGFVWAADVRIAPLISIRVLDRSIGGAGYSEVSLLGLVRLAQAHGPEIDAAILQRYLDETMWFPAAVLDPAITWEAVDANRARATLHAGGQRSSGTFVIDDEGRFVTMTADRYRTVGDRFILTPWRTPVSAYGAFHGVRVPIEGEGIWRLESADSTYIELRVDRLTYDVPPASGISNAVHRPIRTGEERGGGDEGR